MKQKSLFVLGLTAVVLFFHFADGRLVFPQFEEAVFYLAYAFIALAWISGIVLLVIESFLTFFPNKPMAKDVHNGGRENESV